jgi:protocatechuate 3,4-dioxygenase beta subunit
MNKLLNIFFPLILFSVMGCSLSNKTLTKNDGTGPYYPTNPSGLPFYGSVPISNPEIATNDLTIHPLTGLSAQGEKTLITGTVLGLDSIPISGVQVELWNTNVFGSYPTEKKPKCIDPNFFGYGRTKTDDEGKFQFTTIRPLAYTRYGFLIRRPAHFHLKFSRDKFIGIGVEAVIISDTNQYIVGKNKILLRTSQIKEYQWEGELRIVLANSILDISKNKSFK